MSEHDPETGELPATVPAPATAPALLEPAQQQALPVTPFDQVAGAIAAATAEIAEHPVLKEGKNAFHGYMFARLQDVLAVVAPAMAKHGLTVLQSERESGFMDKGNAVFAKYDFVIIHSSGQVWPIRQQLTGVANTRTSKGTFDDKGMNKCHSAARKFFLMSLFQIPTTDDPERAAGSRRPAPIQQPTENARPVTTNVNEPKALPRIGEEPWEQWTQRFLQIVRLCTDLDKVEAWLDTNKQPLEQLRKELPEHHQHVMRQYNKRVLELQPSEAS